MHGREAFAARQELINAMKKDLANKGHKDVAKLMGQGQQRYRRYMQQKPYRKGIIGAVGAGGLSKTPIAKKVVGAIFD